jgi:hypothetical protein
LIVAKELGLGEGDGLGEGEARGMRWCFFLLRTRPWDAGDDDDDGVAAGVTAGGGVDGLDE